MASPIPIVDLGALTTLTSDPVTWSPNDTIVRSLSDDIIKAFSDVGFVYAINHGISQEILDRAFDVTGTFFSLPVEVKSKYAREWPGNSNGWIGLNKERFENTELADYKEAYNLLPFNVKVWPDEVVPGFRAGLQGMVQACDCLARIIHILMGVGLGLEETDYFIKRHNRDKPSFTTLRSLYYPPIPKETEPGMIRCGEHSDFGSISLLFQDQAGGLEVKTRDGQFVPATPIDGSVLINVGDTMQMWTADRLISTRHRVLVPDDEVLRSRERRCLAYFLHPADDEIIRCIDNSDKYPPVRSGDYTTKIFDKIY